MCKHLAWRGEQSYASVITALSFGSLSFIITIPWCHSSGTTSSSETRMNILCSARSASFPPCRMTCTVDRCHTLLKPRPV